MRSKDIRSATWRGIGIPTRAVVDKARRRADRRRQGVAVVIDAMRDGACLQLQYSNGRELWRLSNGVFIPADVAAVVTARSEIVDCGGALFAGLRGQVWRHVGEGGEHD